MISPLPSRWHWIRRLALCSYVAGATTRPSTRMFGIAIVRLTDLKRKRRPGSEFAILRIADAETLWQRPDSTVTSRSKCTHGHKLSFCRAFTAVFLLDTSRRTMRRGALMDRCMNGSSSYWPPLDDGRIGLGRYSTTRIGGCRAGNSRGDRYLLGGENPRQGGTKGTFGQRIADKIPGNAFPGCAQRRRIPNN